MAIWIGSSYKENHEDMMYTRDVRPIKKSKSVIKKYDLIKDIENKLNRGNLSYDDIDLYRRILKELKK